MCVIVADTRPAAAVLSHRPGVYILCRQQLTTLIGHISIEINIISTAGRKFNSRVYIPLFLPLLIIKML
jgi:hypothetical protein